MSDRALPRSWRMMEGFGVHTFRLQNAQGVTTLVKFHWKPLAGVHSVLWEGIEAGTYPEFEFGLQIIEEKDEHAFDFDPLDATKLWPEAIIPVRRVGKLTLNRNPDNFFAETEQVAFCPTHIVPGIDFSNDPLLQGRLFSYLDTQLTRLGGPNFAELPINRPTAPVHTNQRDGFMRHTISTGRAAYEPNSLSGGCPMQAGAAARGFISFPERVDGQKVRERSDSFRDHFSQATLFWNSQSEPEKVHIVEAFQFELGKVDTLAVRQRVVDMLTQVDTGLAAQVAAGIGVAAASQADALIRLQQSWDQYGVTSQPLPRHEPAVATSPELSMANTVKNTIKGRKIAILAADGVARVDVDRLTTALKQAGAQAHLISKNLGSIKSSDGHELSVDKTFPTSGGSVMYDAVFIPGGAESIAALRNQGDAVHFVNEAFRHCKAIAASGEGVDLLLTADVRAALATEPGADAKAESGFRPDPAIITARTPGSQRSVGPRFIEAISQHRAFSRQNKESVPA